jgi:signal transduction histidine kinase
MRDCAQGRRGNGGLVDLGSFPSFERHLVLYGADAGDGAAPARTFRIQPTEILNISGSGRLSYQGWSCDTDPRCHRAKHFDEKMRQSQKLESLGVLAGGVAHDFNNLFTGVLGNASLALDIVSGHSTIHSLLSNVVAASERAAHLTKQLLAYAGKGRFIIDQIDLSNMVREISHPIQRSIPKNVRLRLDLAKKLPCIEADGAQIQQIVMNLAINGAEAIPADVAGDVLVTTRAQKVVETYIRMTLSPGEIASGQYVALEVHEWMRPQLRASSIRFSQPGLPGGA